MQGLARLAEAWLATQPTDPADRLRVTLAAMTFLGALHDEQGHRLPLGSLAWPPERLDELARRAQAWLQALDRRCP